MGELPTAKTPSAPRPEQRIILVAHLHARALFAILDEDADLSSIEDSPT
jgi:hypothetical protein